MSHLKKMVRLRRAQQEEIPLPLQLEIGKRLSGIREAHDALVRQLHRRIDAQSEVLRRYPHSTSYSSGGAYQYPVGGNQYRHTQLEVVRQPLLGFVMRFLDLYVPSALHADVAIEYDVRQRGFHFFIRFDTPDTADFGGSIYRYTVTQETLQDSTARPDYYYLHAIMNNFASDMHRDGWISEVQLREATQEVNRAQT